MSALGEWVLAAALYFAPLETRPKFAGHEETREEALERYRQISEDIAFAAEETKEPNDKQQAAWLLAVAIGESGLSRDVDFGPCYRKGGYKSRCDGGTSFTIWQMKHGSVDGKLYRGRELQKDRRLAARAALRAIRGSFSMCRKLPIEDRLSAYGAGRCTEGIKSVQERYRLFQRVVSFTPKAGA